jgi:hypothetical protein
LKRTIPLLITFFVGLILIIAMFIPHDPFFDMDRNFSIFYDVIAVFAFILGGGNLLRVHLNKVQRKRRDWKYSIVTISGFFLMLIAGLMKIGVQSTLQNGVVLGRWAGDFQGAGSLFKYLYDCTFQPLQSTMFSLLAFFVASASYRYYLTFWLPGPLKFLTVSNLSTWILAVPNMVGQRAIMIGIALGIVSTSLRLILGIERGYLGGE